jgi:hypothetical protein
MKRLRLTALVLVGLSAGALSGCVKTDEGVPVAADAPPTTTATSSAAPVPQSSDAAEQPVFGVIPTSRAPLPTDAVTCAPADRPAVTATAAVPDPQAPRITVAVPDGWTSSAGSGDVGTRLEGPQGLFATVSISATEHEPGAAFTEYADRIMEASAVSSVSVLPAELCQYSGQKLLGAWSDTPQTSVEFADRIAHIWTNTTSYLVAVHVQGPTGTPGFDTANAQLTEDFEVLLP